MATYNDVQQMQAMQKGGGILPPQQPQQPFTAEGAIQMRNAGPRMDGTGQGQGMGLNQRVAQQTAQQGLGLPDAGQIAQGLLQGVVTEQDLASMPQELAMNAVAIADQVMGQQVPQNATQPQGLI